MTIMAEAGIAALLVLGGAFVLIGSWGLVRLPTLMERLHGPTKATTLGLGALLVASMLFFQFVQGTWTAHELLISLFLFITAPISAHMVAKVHLHGLRQGRPDEPVSIAGPPPRPVAGEDGDWATYQAPVKNKPASPAAL